MCGERRLLAEALWGLAKEEQKEYIKKFNKETASLSDAEFYEKYDDIREEYRDNCYIMTPELFDALDTAYDIMNEQHTCATHQKERGEERNDEI